MKKIVLLSSSFILGYFGLKKYQDLKLNNKIQFLNEKNFKIFYDKGLPNRKEHLNNLKNSGEYDVIVIGGGATGSGIALDCVTRGLKTGLIEINDFASGSSSKSTKLIHGGVRYLQKAIKQLDYEQYKMVKEALEERAHLLKVAPHICYPLPIMLPVYKWWQIPYFYVGIKAYDLVAGLKNIKSSYFLCKKDALEKFPMLKKENLCGAIVYYDGQQDDARMNLSIILSAVRFGATILNHCAAINLSKDKNGKLNGVYVKDQLTGEEFEIKAKVIINATGPFTDSIRLMDNPKLKKICMPSAGVHIVLPGYYTPSNMGLLDPATSDKRVIFFLPWQKFTIAGTTDQSCEVSFNPSPSEKDIMFILDEIKKYLNSDINVRRGDVMSAWSGIRPLVLDSSKSNTESLARNHLINESESGLITIAGGKWTTYRRMAEETVDYVIKVNQEKLNPKNKCQTKDILLEGAHNWSSTMFIRLVQDYGLEPEVANHLSNTYGDRAFAVAKLADLTGKRWPITGQRLHSDFPYIAAEVRFAVREYACTAIDVIARRLRISFLNTEAALEILPKVVNIMANELNWSDNEKKNQIDLAVKFINTEMGYKANKLIQSGEELQLSKEDILMFSKQFNSMDKENKGYIGVNDLRRSFKSFGVKINEEELHSMLSEVDVNKNGQVELNEYLQLVSGIKTGKISSNRLAAAVTKEHIINEENEFEKITLQQSRRA